MKKISLLFIFAACFLGFNCVSTEQPQETASKHESMAPKWLTDQGRLELFPNELYVSQLAYGNTAQECKEKAAAKISEYIKASVSYSASSTRFYKESSDNLSKEKSLQEDIQISTTNNLYKLEYTNLYYDADRAQYACVAYINREQAFNYVRPKLEIAKSQFPKAYYAALEKQSALEKIVGIKSARELLPAFYEVWDFARAILPERAKSYEEVDILASESLAKLKELSSVLIRIDCKGDTDLLEKSGVFAELSNQFNKKGYVVSDSPEIDCVAQVEVKAFITKTKETFETYPEIYITILEGGKERFSYAKKLSKVAGFDKETVIRRTNIALTKEIRTSFAEENF